MSEAPNVTGAVADCARVGNAERTYEREAEVRVGNERLPCFGDHGLGAGGQRHRGRGRLRKGIRRE
jgi:hypothetical protein